MDLLQHIADEERLHWLDLPAAGRQLVERWYGQETLSHGVDYWVDLLSADAGLACGQWMGAAAAICTRDAQQQTVVRGGYINEATCLGSDGGLARYRVRLVAWTWWLQHSRCSRVFQEVSVMTIIDTVFAGHQPRARWHWSADARALLTDLPARSFCVQYRESDLAFVARLLAEEGLGWRIEADPEAPAKHRVVLFGDSVVQPQEASSQREGGVRYHRSDAAEAADSVLALSRFKRLGPGRLTLLSNDYRSMRSVSAQLPLSVDGKSARTEVFDVPGEYAFGDRADAQRQALLAAQALESSLQGWSGVGTVRSFAAGGWFALRQWSASTVPELLLVKVWHMGVNNLPTSLQQQADALGAAPLPLPLPTDVLEHATRVGYANRFDAVPRLLPWRPVREDKQGRPLHGRPTAPGPQTAVVIGLEGDDSSSARVYADHLGRVRVRFHFAQPGGAGDSAWLRVMQRYAGPGVGSQFLPRIGQEVLVGFLDGRMERPVVLGALFNGRGEDDAAAYGRANDAAASGQGNLTGGRSPPWHAAAAGQQAQRNAGALWGIQSREWGGAGGSHLLFDDSDRQLRVQMATSQASSQLSLGHLVHQADNHRGSLRGEGFELRTDAAGAVRGERGLWFSGTAVAPAAPAGEAVRAVALLRQVWQLGAAYGPQAMAHGVAAPWLDPPLKTLMEQASATVPGMDFSAAGASAAPAATTAGPGRVPHSGQPILGMVAPQLGIVAGQSLGWFTAQTLTLASGMASNAVVAGSARLHAGSRVGVLAASQSAGAAPALSVVAGEGVLELQAQGADVKLQSRQQQRLASASGAIELAAGKAIEIRVAGGASLRIDGGNITFNCPGTITAQVGQTHFTGPAQQSYRLPALGVAPFKTRFVVRDHAGSPLAGAAYALLMADGEVRSGTTNALGETEQVLCQGPESVRLVLSDERHEGHYRVDPAP